MVLYVDIAFHVANWKLISKDVQRTSINETLQQYVEIGLKLDLGAQNFL